MWLNCRLLCVLGLIGICTRCGVWCIGGYECGFGGVWIDGYEVEGFGVGRLLLRDEIYVLGVISSFGYVSRFYMLMSMSKSTWFSSFE